MNASVRPAALLATVAMLLAGLTACGDPAPATQIIVTFEADQIVQRAARDIEIVVYGGPRGVALPSENLQQLSFNIEDIGGWPITHTLLPAGADPTRLYRIEGNLYDGNQDDPIATVRAISGYVDGQALRLTLRFYGECLYVDACERPEFSCNANGDCQPNRIDSRTLPGPGTGPTPVDPACRTDLDCDDSVSCTEDVCLDGACVVAPDDGRCDMDGTPGTCDAVNGCQFGDTCTSENCVGDLCETASCEGDVCVRRPVCGIGQTCCFGQCGSCNDGNSCTVDSCDEASLGCLNVGGDGAPCTPGDFCDGPGACAGGTCAPTGDPACDDATVCDEGRDLCVGCTNDSHCPPMVTEPAGACRRISGDPDAYCTGAGTAATRITTYACVSGDCVARTAGGMASCTLPGTTDGDICATGAPGPWSSCTQTGGECSTSGERTRTTTANLCSGGACVMTGTPTVERESCLYDGPLPDRCSSTGDAGMDAGVDSSPPDTGVDSGMDTGIDSSPPDTGIDSGMDTGIDSSPPDTGVDSGMDTGIDSDMGFDSSPPGEDTSISMNEAGAPV